MAADERAPVVKVEVVRLDDDSTQIASRRRLSELMRERAADIEEAIAEAARITSKSLVSDDKPGWRVSSLEVTFGLTLEAEAGVIITKATAGASFEIKLTIERR